MVLFTRPAVRLTRAPAFARSLSYSMAPGAAKARPAVLSHGARALAAGGRSQLGGIRTLTGKREKVKVLAVLYDGGEHAQQVCSYPLLLCFLLVFHLP